MGCYFFQSPILVLFKYSTFNDFIVRIAIHQNNGLSLKENVLNMAFCKWKASTKNGQGMGTP